MTYVSLTKFEIAEEQLFHAIELYLVGERLVSVITLAGAAEEILGKLVSKKNKKNAFEEKVDTLCQLEETLFGGKADPKTYQNLKNKTRNELKHIGNDNRLDFDIEQEAVSLIKRGIKNYKSLNSNIVKLFYEFDKVSLSRWRERTKNITSGAD